MDETPKKVVRSEFFVVFFAAIIEERTKFVCLEKAQSTSQGSSNVVWTLMCLCILQVIIYLHSYPLPETTQTFMRKNHVNDAIKL